MAAPDAPEPAPDGGRDADLLELRTGAVAGGGGCVARAPDGRVVFVRHSLPGERVRARVTATTRSYLRADAIEVLEPSPDRVPSPCAHAGPGRCGGCDFQHVALPAQRRLKAFRIDDQLERLAGLQRHVEVEQVEGDRDGLGWRSRVRVAVDRDGTIGFRRHRSHQLEHVEGCPLASPAVASTGALAVRWPGVAQLDVVTGTVPEEAMVTLTPRGRRTVGPLPEVDAGLVVRRSVHREPAVVHAAVRQRVYRISPGVFWQVHTGAARALLDAVLALVGDCRGESVADLYTGAGLFAVPLADAVGPGGTVLAVERDARACADARHNGAGIAALHVRHALVTPRLVADELGRPGVVVLDPAREGAGTDVMAALGCHASTVRRVIYVSCDPASFGRDARVLLDKGWALAALRAFDIFPMTEHVELVAALDPPSLA